MKAHWPGAAGTVAAGVLLATALVVASALVVPDVNWRKQGLPGSLG